MKLYAKIGLGFPKDRKVRRAGPLAELLYLRGVLFSKEILSDGFIDETQLEIVAVGIPDPETHAASLVREGLWVRNDEGWTVPPEVWSEWNDTKDQVESKRKTDRERKRVPDGFRTDSSRNPRKVASDSAPIPRPRVQSTESESKPESNPQTPTPTLCSPMASPSVEPPKPIEAPVLEKPTTKPPKAKPEPKPAGPPSRHVFSLKAPPGGEASEYALPLAKVAEYEAAYQDLVVDRELAAAAQWTRDNRAQRPSDPHKFINNFLGKARRFAEERAARQAAYDSAKGVDPKRSRHEGKFNLPPRRTDK